ncbi:MAG: hypothetical protein MUP13_04070, partial [Thermoanaerobaculales bacterium]|nr:hypothetical protein [Thermoanaerobaculales bacterium]
ALRGRSRSAEVAAARKVFAVLAVEYLDHWVADVAVFLNKHPGSVSRWLETPISADLNQYGCHVHTSTLVDFMGATLRIDAL